MGLFGHCTATAQRKLVSRVTAQHSTPPRRGCAVVSEVVDWKVGVGSVAAPACGVSRHVEDQPAYPGGLCHPRNARTAGAHE